MQDKKVQWGNECGVRKVCIYWLCHQSCCSCNCPEEIQYSNYTFKRSLKFFRRSWGLCCYLQSHSFGDFQSYSTCWQTCNHLFLINLTCALMNKVEKKLAFILYKKCRHSLISFNLELQQRYFSISHEMQFFKNVMLILPAWQKVQEFLKALLKLA